MRTITALLAGLLAGLLAVTPARAAGFSNGQTAPSIPPANLRFMTILHGPSVYLRDLFTNAGPNANQLLGPGPQPGGRIVVEAGQLDAIAREFGVPWRSASSADRAVLEWPGRPLPPRDAIAAVRHAIAATGVTTNLRIDLPGFQSPVIPANSPIATVVSQLDYQAQTGRFTALLSITCAGMDPINLPISGRAYQMVPAPVALTRLLPRTILQAEDISMQPVRSTLLQNNVARSLGQVIGMELTRPISPGQPLPLAALIHPPLVRRGDTVRVDLAAGGLEITGQALAIDQGALGDRIRVQNMNSRAYLFARVIGPDQARVSPTATGAMRTLPPRLAERLPQ